MCSARHAFAVEGGDAVPRLLVFDERRRVREQLRTLLAAVPGVDQVETVSSPEELFERYPHERPDVVLIGTQRAVAGGVETCRRLLGVDPSATVLVMGAPDDGPTIAAAIAVGARGYLRWDATPVELAVGLAQSALDGELPGPRPRASVRAPTVQLTERELQVLVGMSQGKSNSSIGRDLYLSEDTVKKLAVSDRAQSVAIGFRMGLLT
jgi:DNA-binding NarL/FixJ family response regulator